MEFEGYPKTPRLEKPIVITEKIDGTNAQLYIAEVPKYGAFPPYLDYWQTQVGVRLGLWAGSRKHWITPEADNFGFAAWAKEHAEELRQLGPGRHFGEWWGFGIQRGYDIPERRFSLFNVSRWRDKRPACCDVVPVLYEGDWSTYAISAATINLDALGSKAAPGYMRPEGVIVYHTGSNQVYKAFCSGEG